MMFAWFLRMHTQHLLDEIEYLRAELRYNVQRADRAFDQLATLQVGRTIATAFPAFPAEDPLAKDLQKLADDPEFSRVGEIG